VLRNSETHTARRRDAYRIWPRSMPATMSFSPQCPVRPASLFSSKYICRQPPCDHAAFAHQDDLLRQLSPENRFLRPVTSSTPAVAGPASPNRSSRRMCRNFETFPTDGPNRGVLEFHPKALNALAVPIEAPELDPVERGPRGCFRLDSRKVKARRVKLGWTQKTPVASAEKKFSLASVKRVERGEPGSSPSRRNGILAKNPVRIMMLGP
jgi:hypothetical protein